MYDLHAGHLVVCDIVTVVVPMLQTLMINEFVDQEYFREAPNGTKIS